MKEIIVQLTKAAMMLFVVTCIFAGCKKPELLTPEQKLNATSNLPPSDELLSDDGTGGGGNPGVLFAADGVWDLLGFGYDVAGEYGNSSASRFSVIDVEKLKLENSSFVTPDYSNSQYGILSFGENAEDYSLDLSSKLTATVGFKLFKGSINAAFNDNSKFSSKYVYANYNLIVQKKRLRMVPLPDVLKQYLRPSFVANIQSQSPQTIVNMYGTHVLTDIVLGGKLQTVYRTETNSSERKTAAKLGITASVSTVFSVTSSLDLTYDRSLVTKNSTSSLYYKTLGGNSSIALVGTLNLGSITPTIDISSWQSSCTQQNAELIDISKDGLVPIYELVDDPAKKAALKAYILQYYVDNEVKLANELSPIYQFYYANEDHFTTSNPNAVDGYAGWRRDGVDFKAYLYPAPGTVPVYLFLNIPQFNHFLSTNINATWGFSNWQNEGINFYAYQTQVAGTIPIYLYYNYGMSDHFTSSNPNIANMFSGWQYRGIAFYAYPAN